MAEFARWLAGESSGQQETVESIEAGTSYEGETGVIVESSQRTDSPSPGPDMRETFPLVPSDLITRHQSGENETRVQLIRQLKSPGLSKKKSQKRSGSF